MVLDFSRKVEEADEKVKVSKKARRVAREWNQFRNLDLEEIKRLMHRPILVDLRNVYEPERLQTMGFEYRVVGQ